MLGEGEPVMILHGLFGSISNWNPIAKKLADCFQIISVDLRNHGDSEHAGNMTYPDMVEDIRGLMDSLDLSGINLIGHSMGGKVAMGFALTYPDITSKLIVVDVAPVSYEPTFHDYIAAMQTMPVANIKNRNEAEQYLADTIPESMIRQFLLQNLVRKENGFAWRINLAAIGNDLETIAGFPENWPNSRYTGPTCFLAGERSDYIEPEHVQIISRLFPEALLHIIEQAGHWVHAENPAEATDRIRAFLQNK